MFDIISFTSDQILIILLFGLFVYICPKFIKNMLPYSYVIEKIIIGLMILLIIINQSIKIDPHFRNISNTLPIDMNSIVMLICLAILLFKRYHLFNVFFSWSIVSTLGELYFIKNLDITIMSSESVAFLVSKCIIFYALIYMLEIRKFKINSYAIKDNLIACAMYFGVIFLINKLTLAVYSYAFFNYTVISAFIFTIITSSIYVPFAINYEIDLREKR